MAGMKKSKVRRVVKKGQEGNKRSIQSLIVNAREPLSSSSSNLSVDNPLQARLNASSWISTPSTSNALLNTMPVSFSQNANPMAPSPQKRKPIVSLGQSNTFRSITCEVSEKMQSDRRRQISNRARPPKAVIPGLVQDSRCRDPDFLIKDQRHINRGLVHLPKEPDIKRTPNFIRTGYFRFLDLPAEVRNQIYNYLIQPQCYALQWDSEGRRGKLLTHRLPRRINACQPRMSQSTRQRRRDLRSHPRCVEREHLMNDLYRNCSPVALSWVCKKMYSEASSIFYSKSTFIFEGIGPLRHFMNNATPQAKASITKLKLIYKAYGHPAKTEDRVWKSKADRKWEDLCWRISYELTSVTHLILDLDYGYSKMQFVPLFDTNCYVFGTEWRIPLWAFEDLDLKSCACRLRSATTSEAVLEVESYKIRQALLGTAWDDEAEKERDGFGSKMRQKEGKQRKSVGSIQINHKGEVFGLS